MKILILLWNYFVLILKIMGLIKKKFDKVNMIIYQNILYSNFLVILSK